MPNLLIVSPYLDLNSELEELGQQRGFRVRSTPDPAMAEEWLAARPFDVLFAHAEVPFHIQQQLADSLWRRSLGAPFVMFDLEPGENLNQPRMQLYGADLACGPAARRILEKTLQAIIEKGLRNSQDFEIMVVEDLDSPRDIICMFLEGLGFARVTGMPSAGEALAELIASQGKYSCVITDMQMPGMSGAELIQAIRTDESLQNLPVIVLTAYGTSDCLIECLEAGASGFLIKPPKKESLQRELGRAMRIVSRGENPRLANPQDIEAIRIVLEEKGLT